MRERTSPRTLLRALRRQLPDAAETLRLLPRIVNGAVRAAADGELRLQVQGRDLAGLRAELGQAARRRDAMLAAAVLWLSGLAWFLAGPRVPHAGLVAMGAGLLLFARGLGRLRQRRDP